jgi:hypothetical protein
MSVYAEVATFLGSIPASSARVKSDESLLNKVLKKNLKKTKKIPAEK